MAEVVSNAMCGGQGAAEHAARGRRVRRAGCARGAWRGAPPRAAPALARLRALRGSTAVRPRDRDSAQRPRRDPPRPGQTRWTGVPPHRAVGFMVKKPKRARQHAPRARPEALAAGAGPCRGAGGGRAESPARATGAPTGAGSAATLTRGRLKRRAGRPMGQVPECGRDGARTRGPPAKSRRTPSRVPPYSAAAGPPPGQGGPGAAF
jgi:hypothetical protein